MTSTTRKASVALALCAALIAAGATPSNAGRRGDLERKQTYLGHQLKSAKQDLDEANQALSDAAQKLDISQRVLARAQARLDATRGQLAAAQARDAALRAQLAEAEANLVTAQAELDRGEVAQEAAADDVREFAVNQLEDGDPALLAISDLLRGGDPNLYVEKMSINTAVSDTQLTKMQELDAANVMLGIKRDNVEKFRDEVKSEKAAAAQNVVRIQGLESDAVRQTDKVSALVVINTRNRLVAAHERAKEVARVKAIETDRARTEQMIRDLIAQQSHSGGSTSYGNGALTWPIPGAPITSPYGMRWHPILHIYKLHDGVDFGASCGTPIHAAGSGKVISEYYNGAYGNRLLLNNGTIRGTNIVTIYNHMSGYAVRTGSYVSRGQVIGYVGTTGWSTGCHLHFMVVANGVTVNPMPWLP